jgi:hypothetical protein
MVLWGFRWLKFFVNPYAKDDFEHIGVSLETVTNIRLLTGFNRNLNAEYTFWGGLKQQSSQNGRGLL